MYRVKALPKVAHTPRISSPRRSLGTVSTFTPIAFPIDRLSCENSAADYSAITIIQDSRHSTTVLALSVHTRADRVHGKKTMESLNPGREREVSCSLGVLARAYTAYCGHATESLFPAARSMYSVATECVVDAAWLRLTLERIV